MNGHEELSARELRLALVITLGIFSVELVGGIVSNSLALLSDAFALALSFLAIKIAARPPSLSRTFGFHINAASAHIAVEDRRISQLEEIRREVNKKFNEHRINHITLQFECPGRECGTNFFKERKEGI